MEFYRSRGIRPLKHSKYQSRLQLYRIPPVETLGVDEFEELALSRLKCEFILSS